MFKEKCAASNVQVSIHRGIQRGVNIYDNIQTVTFTKRLQKKFFFFFKRIHSGNI